MPNPYGWGQNEPQIKPKDQGGDTIATFSQKIYNLFDSLFNTLNSYPWSPATQSDAGYMSADDKIALDNVSTTYLPLSGGTMTGSINALSIILNSNNVSIRSLLDTYNTKAYGGTGWKHGAEFVLYGKDDTYNSGRFSLRADNGTDACTLIGSPNGTLTWGQKALETNLSNTTAYYRLSSGLQILTGGATSSSSGLVTVNFSHAFADKPRVVIWPFSNSATLLSPKIASLTTTDFSFVCINANNTYHNGASMQWLAFGIGA